MTTHARRIPAAAFAAAVLVLAVARVALGGPSLEDRLRTIADRADLGRGDISYIVLDAATGQRLAERDPERAMVPASNAKLFSSAAALITLGEDFTFRTVLSAKTDAQGQATLVFVGDGDPALGDPVLLSQGQTPLDIRQLLSRLAAAVSSRGITSVATLIVDDRIFEPVRVHETWPREQLNRWYCAEVSGLNLHTNVLSVYPSPTSPGSQPTVDFDPPAPWVLFHNKARTVGRGSTSAWVARPQPANDFTLHGEVRGQVEIRVAVHDPALFAGRCLARELLVTGIPVGPLNADDPYASVRHAEPLERFDDYEPIAIVTTSLMDALTRCNRDSHGLYAEALLKRAAAAVTGEPGSWDSGAALIRMLLTERLGADHASRTVPADGSGMSRANRLSTETIALWLRSIGTDPDLRETFLASLAEPGTGTLRSRFDDPAPRAQLRAKSGFLNGIYALSGYLTDDRTGEEIIFSIIINDALGRKSANAKPTIDSLVLALDEWLVEEAQLAPVMP